MCTLVVAAPSQRKFRDSKISRIQPFLAAVEATSPATNSLGETDSTQHKMYQAEKYFNKNHAYKIGLDGKKKSLTNHELLK